MTAGEGVGESQEDAGWKQLGEINLLEWPRLRCSSALTTGSFTAELVATAELPAAAGTLVLVDRQRATARLQAPCIFRFPNRTLCK